MGREHGVASELGHISNVQCKASLMWSTTPIFLTQICIVLEAMGSQHPTKVLAKLAPGWVLINKKLGQKLGGI